MKRALWPLAKWEIHHGEASNRYSPSVAQDRLGVSTPHLVELQRVLHLVLHEQISLDSLDNQGAYPDILKVGTTRAFSSSNNKHNNKNFFVNSKNTNCYKNANNAKKSWNSNNSNNNSNF